MVVVPDNYDVVVPGRTAADPVTTTMLHSDIEGSTALLQSLGPGYGPVLHRHRKLLRGCFARYDGSEHGTEGDSFMVSFRSASAAVSAALEAQISLAGEPWPPDASLRVRMGLHTGEAYEIDGDLVGLVLHHAARIGAAACGGQILASEHTASAASLERASWRDLGVHQLRDVPPVRLHQLVHDDLPDIDKPPRVPRTGRTNLQAPRTPMIGRRAEVLEVADLVHRERLVTVLGPGGMGKTRLACSVAAALVPGTPGGVWFVDLSGLPAHSSTEEVAAVAQRAMSAGAANLTEVVGSNETLFVLDNCEHVRDAVATLVDELLDHSAARVLATSRAPLAVDGEHIWRQPPLTIIEACELFADRAARAGTTVGPHETISVQELCDRLERMPLAIELAAGRLRGAGVDELRAELTRTLDAGQRRSPQRHRTLYDTIRWSEDLLHPAARVLLRTASVFPAPWTFDDVSAITAAVGATALGDRVALDALVEHSLVLAEHNRDETRFRMLAPIREYGMDQLDGRDRDELARAWVAWGVDKAEHQGLAVWNGQASARDRRRLARDSPNLLGAAEEALRHGDRLAATQIAGGCGYHWLAHDAPAALRLLQPLLPDIDPRADLGVAALAAAALIAQNLQSDVLPSFDEVASAAAALPDGSAFRWLAHGFAGYAAYERAGTSPAERLAAVEDAVVRARQAGNPTGRAMTLQAHAFVLGTAGRLTEAVRALDEGVEVCTASDDLAGWTRMVGLRGRVRRGLADLAGAADDHERAVRVAQRIGDHTTQIHNLAALALLAHLDGHDQLACARLQHAIDVARGRLPALTVADLHAEAAWFALLDGETTLAEPHLEECERLAREQRPGVARDRILASALRTRGELHRCAGRTQDAMGSLVDAVRYVLAEPEQDVMRSVTERAGVLVSALDGLAAVHASRGDGTRAAMLLGAAPGERATTQIGPSWLAHRDRITAEVKTVAGDGYEALHRQGRHTEITALVDQS